jgi:glycine cleavage system H lipoate-binding protein
VLQAASDVYAPVSGEVIEVNEDLKNETGKV